MLSTVYYPCLALATIMCPILISLDCWLLLQPLNTGEGTILYNKIKSVRNFAREKFYPQT